MLLAMQADSIEAFRHSHDHVTVDHHERRTRWVVVLTAAMMGVELVVGTLTNSMALTADGWHMATHAGALGMSALAYWYARTRARAEVFYFGTGKVYALAGYTSAVILGMVAILMFAESARRLLHPSAIHFAEALPVAVIGLLVNLGSAKLLDAGGAHSHDHAHSHSHDHDHDHDADHTHDHGHGDRDHVEPHRPSHHAHDHDAPAVAGPPAHHQDHNLRAAYLHVVADAFTSVLAIAALIGGKYAGWTFLDPLMGIVGGAVILNWSVGLCRGAAHQLLDMLPSPDLAREVRERLEVGGVQVADLHLWDLAPGRRGCIVSLVTAEPQEVATYRSRLEGFHGISHVTVEIHRRPPPTARASGA